MHSGPRVGVLALQGDVREHMTMLRRAGATPQLVRRPADLEKIDGIVIPGGESTTIYKLARAFDLFAPLRAVVASGLPAFGTCAGMILLADRIENAVAGQETIGGLDIVVRRNAFGRQVDSFEAQVDLQIEGPGMPGSFTAFFIRAPWVDKAGTDVEIVAKIGSGNDVGRIVAVRQAHLLATSFHPEMTGDDRIHKIFVGMVASYVAGS